MIPYHKIQTLWLRDPENHHKTLLEGVWAKPEFEYLAGLEWVFTEKVDGTNIRVDFDCGTSKPTVRFGGRTDRAQVPTHLLDRLMELFPAEKMVEQFDCPITLYGEGFGAKIQKGGGNYKDHADFVLFDVRCGDVWLKREDVQDVATKLALNVVPEVGRGDILTAALMCHDGFESRWGSFKAEGLVLRPQVELFNRRGQRVITKIKCKDFARYT